MPGNEAQKNFADALGLNAIESDFAAALGLAPAPKYETKGEKEARQALKLVTQQQVPEGTKRIFPEEGMGTNLSEGPLTFSERFQLATKKTDLSKLNFLETVLGEGNVEPISEGDDGVVTHFKVRRSKDEPWGAANPIGLDFGDIAAGAVEFVRGIPGAIGSLVGGATGGVPGALGGGAIGDTVGEGIIQGLGAVTPGGDPLSAMERTGGVMSNVVGGMVGEAGGRVLSKGGDVIMTTLRPLETQIGRELLKEGSEIVTEKGKRSVGEVAAEGLQASKETGIPLFGAEVGLDSATARAQALINASGEGKMVFDKAKAEQAIKTGAFLDKMLDSLAGGKFTPGEGIERAGEVFGAYLKTLRDGASSQYKAQLSKAIEPFGNQRVFDTAPVRSSIDKLAEKYAGTGEVYDGIMKLSKSLGKIGQDGFIDLNTFRNLQSTYRKMARGDIKPVSGSVLSDRQSRHIGAKLVEGLNASVQNFIKGRGVEASDAISGIDVANKGYAASMNFIEGEGNRFVAGILKASGANTPEDMSEGFLSKKITPSMVQSTFDVLRRKDPVTADVMVAETMSKMLEKAATKTGQSDQIGEVTLETLYKTLQTPAYRKKINAMGSAKLNAQLNKLNILAKHAIDGKRAVSAFSGDRGGQNTVFDVVGPLLRKVLNGEQVDKIALSLRDPKRAAITLTNPEALQSIFQIATIDGGLIFSGKKQKAKELSSTAFNKLTRAAGSLLSNALMQEPLTMEEVENR